MRPIDADALIAELGIAHDCSVCEKNDTPYCRWHPNPVDVCEAISDTPTIEPEKKTGKWIHGRELSREMIGDVVTAIFYEGWECSECHCLVQEEREPLWKFCPNCGTRMDGEKDDVSL